MHYHYHNFWSVQWAKEHLGEMVYWWTPHHTKFFWGTGNWYSFEAGRVVAGLRERLLGWTGLPFLAFVNTCQTCKGVPILQLKTGVFLLALAIGVSSAWPEVSGTCFTLIALATFMFEKSLLYFQPQRVFTICNHCNQSKSKTAKKTACSNLSPASRWGFTGRSGSQEKNHVPGISADCWGGRGSFWWGCWLALQTERTLGKRTKTFQLRILIGIKWISRQPAF